MKRRTFLKLGGMGLLSTLATVAGTAATAEAAPASASTPVICVQACTNINIRQGASIRSRKIGMLYAGETANVLAISGDRGWWCIALRRGSAWVCADPNLTQPIAWRR